MNHCPECGSELKGRVGVPALYCESCKLWWTSYGDKVEDRDDLKKP